MIILVLSIVTFTLALMLVGKNKGWGYAPASLLGLLFVVPIAMLALGFI